MKKKITKIVLIPIKRIMIVFFIFLVLALSSPAQDEISPEPFQEQPEQVTYDDFLQNPTYENYQSLSPEDQARYYENSANVGLRPQIDAFYFDKQENIGKNPESDKTFFSGNYPGGNSRQNFLDHTESAAAYLQKTYRTAYTISDLAAEFFFDPDTGTLQNGVKAIFFADYQDDPAIQEIITLKDGFKIIRTRDEITEDISITGDAHQDIRYQENKLTFVDLAGREQTFTFEAAESTDISFKFQDDSSFEVTGPVSGAIVVSGKLVQFRNYGGTLVLQANGDIKTDNAEVVTSNFYGDGSFEKKGTIVTAQDHGFLIRDGERGVVRDGRTRIIDRTTSVGVVTQGQTGENRVTIHLDELSDRSDFAAPSPAVVEEAVDAERARQEARQLRPAAGDLGKNAEVYISRDEQTQDVIVTSKGSVDVGFYTVGDRGGAVLKEGTPHFLGENGKSELDMRVGQHSVVNVRGKGTYADGQYSTLRAHEDGTSLKITRPGRDLQDALVVDCFACAAGTTALEMSKSIISAQQTALAAVFQKDAELTFDVSVTVTDDGLRYAPRLDNLGRLAEEQTKGGTLIFGRDLLMKIPCGENECNFALTRDQDTNSIQGFFEQFDPATKQTTAPTPIDFSAGNVLGEEVVVTSEKNVESINKLVELIENKQFAQLSEAKLEFDDDPALRKLIRAEIGIDIALLDNVPYRQKVGDALEQRQKAVQQLDAGEIIIVDPAQPLLERDLSKIYIDSNGNPLSPEDAQKIQRLRKTQTAQFYLYTAGRANLAKADIAEAEALRDAGGISKAEFEERKKTQNKIIFQMQQLRKDVAVEIEERKTLMDINSGIMPIGFEDSSAQVQELGNKRTREVRELREVENNLAIAQARINEIKESGVLEQENKFLQEDARVELESLERSIPALAEGAWQRKKNLASLDTEILLIAGTYAADRPDAAAELALQGGLPEVALDSSNALEKIAPGKSAELQTEAAYASGVQEIAEQEISKQALSDYQREKVRFLLKQGDLATAVLTLQEMDPSIGGNAEENQKLAEELVWKELVDRADFEYNDRKDVAYHKHQQSLEERSGVGGFFTYFGRQISPINVYYLVTEGESKVIDTYDELDRNSIRRLSESEDQARALLVTLQALKEEGLTPQEAMERIRTLQIASPQARDAIAGETSTTFFHNLRNEMRGQYQTKDDIAMQAMEEVEKQITFNNGKVAPVEAQLRAITNEFPGTAASEQASRRLRELYRVEDLTFYNVLPTEALDTYGDAAMEVADITDVIPVGALLKVAKLAKGTKVAKVGSKLTTAVELSKWNKRIHFTSEARALEKVVGQARSELRLALKTGDTELIAAATKNLDEIKTAQQGLELSGSKLGNWWQNTALGKKRGITTAENVAYEGQRQAVKLLRDNIAEVGIKNVDQNLISGVQQANKVVEEATTFAARSNAVIDYTNEKVTPPTTLDSSVAKVDAFNSELVSQTHSIPKPVADDVVDNIDALDNAGAQLGPTLRYDPATLPSELQPRAAAVEKALDDLQVSPEEVARRAQQEAAAEAEFAASEFATSQRISGEARQQAVGSSADVLPEVHSSISTDLPAPRKRATAPGGPTEFTPPETIESGFNDAVSGTSRAVHSPEVPSRFLKQKQQFLAQPFDEDALADGVASAFIQYQKTGEFSPELNLLLSRLHGEPSEAAVGRVADKITSALQREGGPQLADTFQAYKDVVFGKGRFSVEYKPVYEIAGVTDEIRRYTIYDDPRGTFQVSDLNERVLKRRNGLAAQGIEEDKGGMRNMLNIMLEGEVRFGQTGPLVKGLPEWAAGPHGPYYVVLDESKRVFRTADDPLFRYSPVTFPEDAHVAYLVPLEADRELVSRALDEAVKKNLLTAAERDAILSKTITYDDYLRLPDEALQGPQELAAELKIGREPEPAELADMGRLDLSQANAVTPTERQVTAGRTLQSKITELEQAPVGSAVGRQAGDDLYAIATQDTHGALKLPVFENKLPSEYTLYEVSMDRGTLKGLNDRSYETGSAAISAQHQNLVAFAKQHNLPVTTLQKTTYIAVPKGIPLDENALLTAIGKAESSVSAAAGENVALRVGIADSAGGRLVETRLKTRRSLEFVSETGAAPVKYGDKIQGWYDDLPLEQKADVNDIFQGYDPRLQDEFDELDNLRAAGDGEAYRKKLSDLAVTDMQDANFKNIETVKAYQFNPGTAVQEGDLVIAYDGIELGAKNKEDILRLTEQGLPDDKLAALAGKRIDRSITEVNQRILDTYVDAVNNIKAVSATTLNQYSAIAQAAGWEAITNVDELRDFLQWEFANKGRFRGGDEGFATIRKVVVDANPNFAGNVRGVIRACGDPCGYEIRVGVKEVSAGEDYLSAIAKADEAVALSKKQGDIPVVISSAGEMKIVEEGIPEVSFIEVPVAGLESPQVPILHPQRAEEIFFNVEQKVGIELNPDARLYLYDVAEEINEKFLPNHGINSLEGAQAAFREGKLVSMKTLQQRGLVEAGDISLKKREKLGTADSVFISAKGPFGEFVDDTAPLIIFKKEMLGQPGVKFTPLDSGANYDTAEDIARGGLKDKNELDIYYNAYLRNRGRFQHLWEDPLFAKAEKSFYPEARFTGSVDIADNAEAILLTDENYKILIADPEISPEIKMLFVNVGDKSTTDAYYEFTGLDNYLDKDLDDLVEIASPANIQIAPCPLVGGAIMSPLFGNAVAAPCLPPTLPTKAITFPPQEVPTPKVVSKVQGYGPASNLYDRVSPENINEVFQNKLELLGPDIYGAKAVAYVHDDGSIQVVFLTESDKTHHRHALGTIIGGEKGELVYNGKYGDFLAADIADRSFGFEFQYDASKGKIIGIEHSSQITRVQFEKGKTGWKLSDSVVDTVEEQVLEKIDLDLFDESFIDKPFDEWTARNEIPVTS